MKKAVTGIKPTGILTLGNYLGAVKNFVAMQDEYDMNVFIANLHSITVPYEKTDHKQNIKQLAGLYLACGLDPSRTNLFLQSDILEHAQLGHILLCNTTMSELQKMTQYKDKSQNGGIKMENGTTAIPTGLFTYPTLMAADILLYQPDIVPVGEDQKQHVELTRNIAERMNNKFGDIFKVPEPVIAKVGAKIMSLTEPTKKMSKSSTSEKSFISLLDKPEVAKKKIMSAIADSDYPNVIKYDKENKPGVSNLMVIHSCLSGKTIQEIENDFIGSDYKVFKTSVADLVGAELEMIQTNYNKIIEQDIIDKVLDEGADKVKLQASRFLNKVQNKTGINYRRK